ncbi:FAD:protein FMN transferase [Cryobacterium sp. PAMC25264]|uniref:FAD:protein FMN transferase n=1 Tax=Cryobacterium sp. PAMC25264 TaxID=2861288 RepID=UPI001C634CE5|nr:FAD:protein FMN transferase [Cryobacterium sp. PAMC25264]QYF74269.1 FAD:protein FMN transferase [Cryobacterium sp. PAMC25264]
MTNPPTPLTPVFELTPDPVPTGPARPASRDWTLWSTSARLVVTDPDQIGLAATLADALLADVDRAASRFRADSELQLAAGRLHAGVGVSNTLADLVRQALASAALTDGDVDPTLGTRSTPSAMTVTSASSKTTACPCGPSCPTVRAGKACRWSATGCACRHTWHSTSAPPPRPSRPIGPPR